MAGKKRIPDLNAIGSGDLDQNDVIHTVDVSDTTSHSSGTSFKLSFASLLIWLKAQFEATYGAQLTRWPSWGEVTSKPTEFTPSSHTHYTKDVINWARSFGTQENIVDIDLGTTHNVAVFEPSNIINTLTVSNSPDGPIIIKIEQGGTGYAVNISGGNWKFNSGDEVVDNSAGATTELHCFYESGADNLSIIKNIKY